jgi:hypothetical protein
MITLCELALILAAYYAISAIWFVADFFALFAAFLRLLLGKEVLDRNYATGIARSVYASTKCNNVKLWLTKSANPP